MKRVRQMVIGMSDDIYRSQRFTVKRLEVGREDYNVIVEGTLVEIFIFSLLVPVTSCVETTYSAFTSLLSGSSTHYSWK